MPNLYLLSFELLLYGLLLFAARHAWRNGGLPAVWQLVVGVAFGVLLEWATIRQLDAYAYGRFLIMFGDVPLAVGVGWGVIIYSAQCFSNATSLPPMLRPVLDGLLALNIDLAMDAVAIRLGMWQWGIDLTAEYFGVPYANFWAWFWVVSSFSAGVRFLAFRDDWLGRWLAPAAGVLVGLIVVLSTNTLVVYHIPRDLYVSAVVGVLGTALALVILARPHVDKSSVPPVAAWVPLVFHLYFLTAGLLSGVFMETPFLLFVSVLMTLIALALHVPITGFTRSKQRG
jgi:hypothetical protein